MAVLEPIAYIYTEFPEKFGIPRQSGLAPSLRGRIVLEPQYQSRDWVRGLEEYSHIWVIFDFSQSHKEEYSPLVLPPRLGGKHKKGVFATRCPVRPNSLGLSSLKLEEILFTKRGTELIVAGADLLNGTPIYDIKPYLPYADCHMDAKGSFGEANKDARIQVVFREGLKEQISETTYQKMLEVLEQDPRAAYNKDPEYVYGLSFMEYDIRFRVSEDILEVFEILRRDEESYARVK